VADASLRFEIDADHGQFYIQDLEMYDAWMREHAMDPDLPPAGWTWEAVQIHRIGVEPHSISVGTARDYLVESLITIHASAPAPELSAEHIVEVDLDVPNGKLALSSPGVDPADGPSMTVPGGLLRVRVSYVPSELLTVDTDGRPGDCFLYQIDLWSIDQPGGLVIFKQGSSPWAG
jgi:hypothetical protein